MARKRTNKGNTQPSNNDPVNTNGTTNTSGSPNNNVKTGDSSFSLKLWVALMVLTVGAFMLVWRKGKQQSR